MRRSSPIKVICFDFDGTIVDTMPFLERIAVSLIVGNYGLAEEEARRRYIETTGLPFFQQLETIFGGDERNHRVAAQFEKMKRDGFFSQKPCDGAVEVLSKMREMGLFTAISSSTYEDLVKSYCASASLEADMIMGYKPGFEKGKDHFDNIKRLLGVEYREIVFIGDSLNDLRRSKSCGVSFMGLKGLFCEEDFRRVDPACMVLENIKGVPAAVGRLLAGDEEQDG